MADRAELIFANESFYRAFADRDLALMQQVWAKCSDVACIHPGWTPLHGREAVLESWRRILANEDSPKIDPVNAVALILGESGVVICYEKFGDDYLVASNVFVREDGGWKLVHHQAGPVAEPPPEPPPKQAPSVH